MSRTKIALLLLILGWLIFLFTGLGFLIILGIVLMWSTRNDFLNLHKRCVTFSALLFVALYATFYGIILQAPVGEQSLDLAYFIFFYGLTLVLAVLVYGLETKLGRNLVWVVIFSSFLGHALVFINLGLAGLCRFIAQLSLFAAYFIAYKNTGALKEQAK